MQRARKAGVSCEISKEQTKGFEQDSSVRPTYRFIPDDAVTQDSVGLVSP